jgi:N-acyl-D-aspartate/D-glutamate deacylase
MPTQSFTLAVMLEDESGNLSDDGAGNPLVCSVIGYVDGEAPLVTASQVTTEPAVMDSAGNLVSPLGDG